MRKTIEDFEGRTINAEIAELKELFKKQDSFNLGKEKFIDFHTALYPSSSKDITTFEDLLWEGVTEEIARKAINKKGRTIIYGLWHSARIEDMTMNVLVNNSKQVYYSGNFDKKINAGINHTGNSLSDDKILTMSSQINIKELKNYRKKVKAASQKIIKSLHFSDLKRKVKNEDIEELRKDGSVDDVESANWLLDFWGNKSVSGILFMPACRHLVVHLRESFEAKKRGLKNN